MTWTMTETDDTDTLPLEFIRECILLGRRWRARVDEQLKDHGLTAARLTVLYWVNELPAGTSQRELADIVGIEGPTLVRQLHALQAQGLIERVPMTSDRRAKCIRLTPEGLKKLEGVNSYSLEMSREYFPKLERRRLPSAIRLAKQAREAIV
ncbi:MAG TPA: MarR family transcriptional regulator [Sphingomonas sp.]|nr:MarR family transcriptional regulator [Sphingomonas sp.]